MRVEWMVRRTRMQISWYRYRFKKRTGGYQAFLGGLFIKLGTSAWHNMGHCRS